MKTETKKRLSKLLNIITMLSYGLVLAYALEVGFRKGLLLLIITSIIIGLFRLAIQWRTYMAIIDFGASMIRASKEDKKENVRTRKDIKHGKKGNRRGA